jgi:hypothetical protein
VTKRAPIADLTLLEALQATDFSLWFFLPRTEALSRQRWLASEREANPTIQPSAWTRQADAIRSSARHLRPFFRDRCIETLCSTGELLDAEELATRLGIGAPA